MSVAANISPLLKFDQVIELVKTLPQKEKQHLLDLLNNEDTFPVPEWQKKRWLKE